MNKLLNRHEGNKMSDKKLLLSIADELKSYIDDENERLRSKITCINEDPPDYHDYQSCHELQVIANKMD